MTATFFIWLLFGACLILSFVLSGMEAGVFALSRLRIRQRLRAGNQAAQVLYRYLENSENFLWTILVGNTVANFIILGWLIAVLHESLGRHRILFAAVFSAVVFLFYSFFDLLPKILFRRFPNRLALLFARPFRAVDFILRPLVNLVERVSGVLMRWRGGKTFTGRLFGNREELRLVMQESAQGFTSEERTMINRVLDLQTLTVRQTMKPLSLGATVTVQTPLGEALALARERRITRFPVWDQRDGSRRIAGLLSMNTVLYQADLDSSRRVGDYIQPALFLEEDLRLEVALRRMQRSGQRLGIVLGRDGRESGILTLQDVLRVIFGEVSL